MTHPIDAASQKQAENEKSLQEIAVDMGFDAMRLALTGKTKNYKPKEVILFLQAMASK